MKAHITLLLALAAATASVSAADADDERELIWRDGKWVRQAPAQEGTPAGELAIVRRDMDKKDYAKAVKHAKRFLKRYPYDPLAEEILALGGDAQMARGRYWDAYKLYERQLQRYPIGLLAERSMQREMEIAQAWLAGRKRRLAGALPIPATEDALEALEKIAERAAGSDRGQTALLTIADHYFDQGKWSAAAETYDGFLKMYAKSPRAGHAELRAAEAYRRSYRGAFWDETPLIEAEQRYKAFAQRHPAQARRAKVEQALGQIHEDRAAKQYEVGRFYVRLNQPGAATHYFNIVLTEYADTPWASRAQAEMAKLPPAIAGAGSPPQPAGPVTEGVTEPAQPAPPAAPNPAPGKDTTP